MKSFYDAIYLSPHLDDAVLSCGGQIYQLTQTGHAALIVSIMAGDTPTADLSEFAQSLHDRWEVAQDAVAVRREEDATASDLLGADYLHLDLLDCIYRSDPDSGEALYATEEALFGDLHPAELTLAQTLARTLANLPASGRVLAPLTAGHHVDHQLTRLAAELWLEPDKLLYYEEFPYVLAREAMPVDIAGEDTWRSQIIELSDEALAMRIEATACYRSQLSTFFRDRHDLVHTVSNFVQNAGGERIWRQIAP